MTAIKMNEPSTVVFDIGFDSGTGFGLVNGSVLNPKPPVPVTTPVAPTPALIAPNPVPVPNCLVQVLAPNIQCCGLFRLGIFCCHSLPLKFVEQSSVAL
jgi:hypothetical protein